MTHFDQKEFDEIEAIEAELHPDPLDNLNRRFAQLEQENKALHGDLITTHDAQIKLEADNKALKDALRDAVQEIKYQMAVRFNSADFETTGEKLPVIITARALLRN